MFMDDRYAKQVDFGLFTIQILKNLSIVFKIFLLGRRHRFRIATSTPLQSPC